MIATGSRPTYRPDLPVDHRAELSNPAEDCRVYDGTGEILAEGKSYREGAMLCLWRGIAGKTRLIRGGRLLLEVVNGSVHHY